MINFVACVLDFLPAWVNTKKPLEADEGEKDKQKLTMVQFVAGQCIN